MRTSTRGSSSNDRRACPSPPRASSQKNKAKGSKTPDPSPDYWDIWDILDEKKDRNGHVLYRVKWKDHPVSGKKYNPSWVWTPRARMRARACCLPAPASSLTFCTGTGGESDAGRNCCLEKHQTGAYGEAFKPRLDNVPRHFAEQQPPYFTRTRSQTLSTKCHRRKIERPGECRPWGIKKETFCCP